MNNNSLSQNRAEEFGYDLWEEYVIPPFFSKLDLVKSKKPKAIIGGRGCGKTMLLRYLSHQSMFSPLRKPITEESLTHIGLYWRVDTQISQAMHKRSIEEDVWHSAFGHLITLLIGIEVLKSMENLASSDFPSWSTEQNEKLTFSQVKNFDPSLPINFSELRIELRNRLQVFQSWLNNVRNAQIPLFLPIDFLKVLTDEIITQNNIFKPVTYFVYLDEFENLLGYQQKIVNTWIKHSEMPLIFNIAMKRNAWEERSTVGKESLSHLHDYRQYDLEETYNEDGTFKLFAAEILLFRLYKQGFTDLPVNIDDLRDPEKLLSRKNEEYKKILISKVEEMFPDVSHSELAKQIFTDKELFERLKSIIATALSKRNSILKPEDFLIQDAARASVTCISLLYREKLTPEDILAELKNYIDRKDNKFSGKTDWIGNNFIGCLLLFYEPLNRVCPFYAGFDTFCEMSHGNIRHLMELCYKTFIRASLQNTNETITEINTVTPTHQAEAAKQASTIFLGEIRSFGNYGNQLHTFVLRIGALFHQAHKRLTQSEPEQNHFSIKSGEHLNEEYAKFLSEAVKWSVLYEERSTKAKAGTRTDNVEYVLSPIYASYFKISYRKIRKLELSIEDLGFLIDGKVEDYEKLIKKFNKKWKVENTSSSPSLFSNLNISDN